MKERSQSPTWLAQVLFGALALVIGFGVAAAPRLLDGDDSASATKATRGNPRAVPTALATPGATRAPELSGAPPAASIEAASLAVATPTAAVEAFLRGEVAGDFSASYGLLGAEDRSVHQSRAGWTAAHAQLPVVRGFALGVERRAADRAEVDGTVTLKPELGPVVGLVAAAATVTWVLLPEDGGWRLAFGESTLTPAYISADTAPAAARSWVLDRAGCPARSRARLFGAARLFDALCAARGSVRVDAPVPFEPGESSNPFLAAYGPDVFDWARVVPVTQPARVGVVLAPLGPRWRVIGVVDLPAAQAVPPDPTIS